MSDVASRRSEYESAGLDVADVDPDPRAAVAALVRRGRRRRGDRAATRWRSRRAGEDGVPDVRFVLVRGVDERGFAFYTNLDERQGAPARPHQPAAAAAFGWLQLHRQVRLRGTVERVTEAESDAYFASRPRGSRIGAWASPQSDGDRRPRRARRARARGRRALRRRWTCRGPSSGAASASCPPRSSSGRAGRAASTTGSAIAGRAPPGRSSASRPRARTRGARARLELGYTLPMLTTVPLPALVP